MPVIPPPIGANQINVNGWPAAIFEDGTGNGVTESVDADGPRANVLFKVDYATRYEFLKRLGGYSEYTGGTVVRHNPFAYPPSPNMYCFGIGDIKGIKPRRQSLGGWLDYELAIVPAIFTVPKWSFDLQTDPNGNPNDPTDLSGQPWTTTDIRVNGEVFTPPGGTYYYIAGFGPKMPVEDSTVGIIKCHAEISIKRHWLPYIPIDEAMTYLGTVNKTAVSFGNRVFLKGTLLFAGFGATKTIDTIGNITNDVTYTVLAKTEDWNEFTGRDGSQYLINSSDDGSGSYPYSYVDFWKYLP